MGSHADEGRGRTGSEEKGENGMRYILQTSESKHIARRQLAPMYIKVEQAGLALPMVTLAQSG